MTIHIGISGTRKGCTPNQLRTAIDILHKLFWQWQEDQLGDRILHHGSCVGVDEQLCIVAVTIGYKLEAHPPIEREFFSHLATYMSKTVNDPADYLVRNKEIVDRSKLLIAVPDVNDEQLRSGTWATIRHARRTNVPRIIIYLDGTRVGEDVDGFEI